MFTLPDDDPLNPYQRLMGPLQLIGPYLDWKVGQSSTWNPWNLSFRYILFHEKDCKQRCDTTAPESIHTKDESKRGSLLSSLVWIDQFNEM